MTNNKTYSHTFVRALIVAVVVAALGCIVGVSVNWFHPRKIPLFAEEEYQILVPCPVPGGAVEKMSAQDSKIHDSGSFIVDARLDFEFEQWHLKDAKNITFDYLDPTPEKVVLDLADEIARRRATRVIVYGDGSLPDSGEQLGKEISGKGIKNVFYIEGGADALQEINGVGGRK